MVPFQRPAVLQPGAEYHLTVRFLLADEAAWAPKGHEVAWEQFQLPLPVPPKDEIPLSSMADLVMKEEGPQLTVAGAGFQAVFSKTGGLLTAYRAHGQELLVSGPRENYFRAPTDFDLLMGNPPAPIHEWRAAGLDRLERTVLSF